MNHGKDTDKTAQSRLTNGTSDAEAGGPGGSRAQEIDQELAALESMYQRSLIDDDDYTQRRAELQAERAELINHK